MSFKIIADSFSVSRDSNHFIQIKTIKKPRSEEYVWLVIEIEGEGKYARAATQNMIEILEDVFFDDSDLDAYERLENALKEVNVVIKNLKEKHGAKNIGEVSAIIAALSGYDLHLTSSKNAEAYLIRGGKFSMISEGLTSKADDLFVSIASGELMPEDKIVIATTRLLRLATHSQLAEVFDDGVTESLDSIRELVLAEEDINLGVLCAHAKIPHAATKKMEAVKGNPQLKKAMASLSGLADKVTGAVQSKMKGRKGPEMDKKTILVTLVVVVLLLFVSVSLLMDRSHNKALREEYRLRIEAMNEDLRTAKTKGYTNDKESANAILDKVNEEARAILDTNFFRAEILALLDKVQETRDSINNTDRIEVAEPYVDLSTKRETVEALGLVSLDGNFQVYEYNALYEVILNQVLDPKTIDESEVVIAATPMEDQGSVIFLTQSGRIIESADGQFRFANTEDEVWKAGVDLASFGRFIYVLSPDDNQIYKYAKLRSDYSSGSQYNIDADVTGGKSIAIDGDIYVLKEGGEIVRIFKSNRQDFNIEDLAADLGNATKIRTRVEHDHLYVLDPVDNRIIVIEKLGSGNGLYRAQYVFEDLDEIQDFYVNDTEEKLFLLTKKKIYQVDI